MSSSTINRNDLRHSVSSLNKNLLELHNAKIIDDDSEQRICVVHEGRVYYFPRAVCIWDDTTVIVPTRWAKKHPFIQEELS